ncbi:MAG: zinc ribbon domain-containing protein [Desulfobacterales bacterium]|nr:zinc ribbon domain-containing protein [Desulfobacterales bacterium]MBF0397189.1 zinc ribbon domain-containing protein [Desulfobacterales bacterium]
MPIYEYHCKTCNKDFECLVFGKEEPECPTCNNKNVERILSSCGFVSKGKGGETTRTSSSSCGSCSSGSCGSCGH